jgi:heme exporter protein B
MSKVDTVGAAPLQSAPMGVVQAILWSASRDLRDAIRSPGELGLVLVFFVLVASLFPLTINPEKPLLQAIGPGVIWVAALLASLMGLPRLFIQDMADGTLEQLVIAPAPLGALISGKVLAHWLATGLPLVVVSPLIALQYSLDEPAMLALVMGLVLGTPTLAWIGAITSALTLTSRAANALLALLVLPLAVPVLIFGASAVHAQSAGLGLGAHLSILGAGMIVSCVLGPLLAALAVRIAVE